MLVKNITNLFCSIAITNDFALYFKSLTGYVSFQCFLISVEFSKCRFVFCIVLEKIGTQNFKYILVKPEAGTIVLYKLTSVMITPWIYRLWLNIRKIKQFIQKRLFSTLYIALWVSREIFNFFPVFIVKMCKSMLTGVILCLQNLWKPTTTLTALLINSWRPLGWYLVGHNTKRYRSHLLKIQAHELVWFLSFFFFSINLSIRKKIIRLTISFLFTVLIFSLELSL